MQLLEPNISLTWMDITIMLGKEELVYQHASEVEMKEKKDRVDDALHATRAA